MATWRRTAYRAARPLLFTADAEAAHDLTLSTLALAGRSAAGRALCGLASGAATDTTPVQVMGLTFRNRVGLGAGFDKDGVAVRGWAALGLGFIELGTVTPRPQAGNPRPRLFRLTGDEALVNRMGFNNRGADALARRLAAVRRSLPPGFVIGVNVGRNRDTPTARAGDDYAAAARAVAPVADYLAINVSSPNTPRLRDLGRPERIGAVVNAVAAEAPARPLVVKLSPDLRDTQLDEVIDALSATPARGVVVSNTSVRRNDLRAASIPPDGGVSGRPLLERMLACVGRVRDRAGDRLVIVASGGIAAGDDARTALDAGADLVQLWTGLVYAGPGLIGEAVRA